MPSFLEYPTPFPVANIVVRAGREPLREDVVAMMMRDIQASPIEEGVVEPILVRVIDDERVELVDGLHRLEAAKRLGHKAVPVKVAADLTETEADLLSISLNINRKHYDVADRLDMTERYLAALPAVEAQALAKRDADATARREVREEVRELDLMAKRLAEALGIDERTAYLNLQWLREVTPEARAFIKQHGVAKVAVYKEAAKRDGAEAQLAFLEQVRLDGGKVVNRDGELKGLVSAWTRAAPETRYRFIEAVFPDASIDVDLDAAPVEAVRAALGPMVTEAG